MRGFFGKQGVKHFVGGDDMLAEAKFRDPFGASATAISSTARL